MQTASDTLRQHGTESTKSFAQRRPMNTHPQLDVTFARSQFPAFAEPSLHGHAHFENAGGSYACAPVVQRLHEYYRRLKVQPYYGYPASTEAGEWMDASYVRLAEYLGVTAEEVHFGPSTSQNTYVLAQALRQLLKPGDQIIVTDQDHEANSGAWRRLTREGAVVREWCVDPATGELPVAQLDALLTDRTRLLVLPHASNVVAHINPIATIAAKARAAGAIVVVDGVAWAPHGLPDVPSLGADVYLFSLYKTFGPHQGLMVLRRDLLERLGNEGHYFNATDPRKRLIPAGADHAQVAAAQGIAEYFDALDMHHGGKNAEGRAQRVRQLLRAGELAILPQLLDYLASQKSVRLLGPAVASQRAATVAFVTKVASPGQVAARLAQHRIMAGHGHFYAKRLVEALGVDPATGVVRLSFVHYTSPEEMRALITALHAALV
jgi:selenocysteine lyase/cysteine desulfurase